MLFGDMYPLSTLKAGYMADGCVTPPHSYRYAYHYYCCYYYYCYRVFFIVVIIGSVITVIVILSMIMIVITIIIPEARQPLQSSEALRDALRQIPFSRPQLRDEGAQEDANRAKNKRKCPAVM